MRRLLLVTTVALVALPFVAAAQTTAPSRIASPDRPDQTVGTQPRPSQSMPPNAPAPAPAVAQFTLRSVSVTGSSLPAATLEAAWVPFIGKTLQAADLQHLSDAIAEVYGRSDVALFTVLIPQQDTRAGDLTVRVIEGRVSDVKINQNDAGNALPVVDGLTRPLIGQAPLSKKALQRQITVLRDTPGLNTNLNLLAGDADDAVVLDIAADLEPVQFSLGVNNRGTRFLGRTQAQADLYLNSLLRAGDQTVLTLAAPTDDDLFLFAAASHSTPLGLGGTRLSFNGSYLRTTPAGTALEGHAAAGGVQIAVPLLRSYQKNATLFVGIDGVNADNALLGNVFSDDRTRAARIATTFSKTSDNSALVLVGSVSGGISGLGARTFSPSVTDLEFLKVNLRATYNHTIGEHVVVRLKAAGQFSDDALPGSEQMALGGVDFGRAYEASIVSGDRGYGAGMELAYRPDNLPAGFTGSELYSFVDGGDVTYLARGAFAPSDYKLVSYGAGVRLNVTKHAVVEIEAARAGGSSHPFLANRDWRGVVSLRSLF